MRPQYYVEFPADPVVNVHWKKKDEPPDPGPDGDCIPGTWTLNQIEDGTTTLTIHDALTVEHGGVPGDRTFNSPPGFYNFFCVFINSVEFGPPDPVFDPKDLYGRGLVRLGSKLLIEGSSTPGTPVPPPSGPPFPKLPMYTITPHTDTLSFSRMTSFTSMPVYPPTPFMVRSSSWEYLYNMMAPPASSYPNFDPNAGGGPGAFYLTSEGGSTSFSPEYQAWYDYYYLGIGGDPGTVGDQFYNNTITVGSTFFLKLTQICGPSIPPTIGPHRAV